MTKLRLIAFILALVFVLSAGYAVSLLARGYRLDTKNLGIKPTGILVATSTPQGAQILINGELETATNATINLPPNSYDIEIKKEGLLPWKKRLVIKKEEVTKIDAILFPGAPSLSSLTTTGVLNPVLSPDGTKIAYGVPPDKEEKETKTGLWIMELADLPIGFSREPRQITDASPKESSWRFSPDSREILFTAPKGNFVLGAGGMTPQNKLVNLPLIKLNTVLEEWKKEEDKKLESNLARLPKEMQDILRRKSSSTSFAPDENKVLYTASGSAQIPEGLIRELPGSSTQKQERSIKDSKTYVYDIKEDRNFLAEEDSKDLVIGHWSLDIGHSSRRLAWFPTSNHLVLAEPNKITIMDYDGTNRQIVWATPYEAPYAIPSPNTQQLLILTSLGAGNGNASNLYALRLR